MPQRGPHIGVRCSSNNSHSSPHNDSKHDDHDHGGPTFDWHHTRDGRDPRIGFSQHHDTHGSDPHHKAASHDAHHDEHHHDEHHGEHEHHKYNELGEEIGGPHGYLFGEVCSLFSPSLSFMSTVVIHQLVVTIK